MPAFDEGEHAQLLGERVGFLETAAGESVIISGDAARRGGAARQVQLFDGADARSGFGCGEGGGGSRCAESGHEHVAMAGEGGNRLAPHGFFADHFRQKHGQALPKLMPASTALSGLANRPALK